MSRWSPSVVPRAADPLDFSPLTNLLRDNREQRRYEDAQRRLAEKDREEDEAREREARVQYGAESAEEYNERQPVGGRAMDDALHRPFTLGVTPGGDRAGSFDTGPAQLQQPAAARRDELVREAGGEELPPTNITVNGKQFVIDPMRQLQQSRARLTIENAAKREGEREGTFRAALDAGVEPDVARRYVFGPAGLTATERAGLEAQRGQQQRDLQHDRGVTQMQLETYKWGRRAELQDRKTKAAYGLLAARQAGNAALAKQYLAAYKGAQGELAMADKQAGFYMNMIGNDPIMLQMKKDDEQLGPLVSEAGDWLDKYFLQGGRQQLVNKATDAGEANATAQGRHSPDTRQTITQEEYDELVRMGKTPDYLKSKYRVRSRR